MNKYAIVTDSCSDLNKEFRRKHNIDYAHMSLTWTDKNGVKHTRKRSGSGGSGQQQGGDANQEILSTFDIYKQQ